VFIGPGSTMEIYPALLTTPPRTYSKSIVTTPGAIEVTDIKHSTIALGTAQVTTELPPATGKVATGVGDAVPESLNVPGISKKFVLVVAYA